ncbi:hypothetical protein OKW34_004333 [Paraburkholderia youngii]|uniref:hypothetical protein n=1 Tax=Paraburkholderia youngii TaxID=2782701 RepID=UPI003D1977B7
MNSKSWDTEPQRAELIANGPEMRDAAQRLSGPVRYVGVPADYVLYGVDRLDLVPFPDSWRDGHVVPDEQGIVNFFLSMFSDAGNEIPESHAPLAMLLTAHGLSFAGRLASWPALWFFGFDCGHASDYSLGLHEILCNTGYLLCCASPTSQAPPSIPIARLIMCNPK